MTAPMRPDYTRELRQALVEHVDAHGHRPARAVRRTGAVTAGVVVLLSGAGLAVAAGIFTAPGSPNVRPLTASVTLEGAGTQAVEVGAAPDGTNAVELALTCLTAGTFTGPDGSQLTCGPEDAGTATATWRAPALPGQTEVRITANDQDRWRITASYSAVTTTNWGVNADGQTYGAQNENGMPDLVAVIATNGAHGYARSKDLQPQPPNGLQTTRPAAQPRELAVYEADGKTQVGVFRVG